MDRGVSGLRWAQPEDRPAVIGLLFEMHAEVGIFPLSLQRLEENVDEVLRQGRVLLAVENGAVVGSVGLYVGSFWYSEEKVLMDTWIFTSARAGDRLSVFRDMIAAVRMEGEEQGLPIVLTLFCEDAENRKTRLFSRYGDMVLKGFMFKPVGGDFRLT